MTSDLQLKAFLLTNPTEEEKQVVWDKHMEDVYKDGMIPCCCGNCYQWGWGTPVNGVWYIPGHEPPQERTTGEETPQSASRAAKDLKWLLPIIIIVSLIGWAIGLIADLLL